MLAGNYLVSVRLGGTAAGTTSMQVESSRAMLASVATTAGQTLDYSFVVNVRAMEGQPKHAGGPSGYPGLDLFFSGMDPQVTGIGYALAAPATKPIMVYIASDSTTCDQTGNAFGGWGQMLPEYFNAPIGIANYANSGASSNFGFWTDIKSHWAAGDYVIIQFGHNDKGTADSAVQANLERMAGEAIAANVTPILVSPPARLQGIPIPDQSSLHAISAKNAAASQKCAYVDLTALSTAWYNTLPDKATALKLYHAHGSDATHTNLAGGEKLAGLVAANMKAQALPIAKYLR
jgi:lysophospholipase L1-like esterase